MIILYIIYWVWIRDANRIIDINDDKL